MSVVCANEAFLQLKGLFILAPLLLHPDPERQLVVKLNASDSGVGAVLMQTQDD